VYVGLRQQLKTKPQDFACWTQLLAHVEKMADASVIEECFDLFFETYPLCYGYWKKYADLQGKLVSVAAAKTVYERGVGAVALSVDMWLYYLQFAIASLPAPEVETVVQRAEIAVGSHPQAHPLWERILEYFKSNSHQHVDKLIQAYLRCLKQPLIKGEELLEAFKVVVAHTSPTEYFTPVWDFEYAQSAYKAATLDGETEARRNFCLHKGRRLWEDAQQVLQPRRALEAALGRPYFHVKPLTSRDILSWCHYLDFEEGEHARLTSSPPTSVSESERSECTRRVFRLYERCLIPCASVVSMWERYADWLAREVSPAQARLQWDRAFHPYLRHLPLAYCARAEWEESLQQQQQQQQQHSKHEKNEQPQEQQEQQDGFAGMETWMQEGLQAGREEGQSIESSPPWECQLRQWAQQWRLRGQMVSLGDFKQTIASLLPTPTPTPSTTTTTTTTTTTGALYAALVGQRLIAGAMAGESEGQLVALVEEGLEAYPSSRELWQLRLSIPALQAEVTADGEKCNEKEEDRQQLLARAIKVWQQPQPALAASAASSLLGELYREAMQLAMWDRHGIQRYVPTCWC
jgi:pre-mRNA-processing factor 39